MELPPFRRVHPLAVTAVQGGGEYRPLAGDVQLAQHAPAVTRLARVGVRLPLGAEPAVVGQCVVALAAGGEPLAGAVAGSTPLTAAAAPEESTGAESTAPRRKIPIGIFDPAFPDLTTDQLVEKYASLGAEAIEVGTGGYPNNKHCPVQELLDDPAKLRAWRKKFDDHNIQIATLSCHGNPVHPDQNLAARDAETFRRTVLLAEKLGVKVIVGFSGCPGANPTDKNPNWITYRWPPEYAAAQDWQWKEKLVPYWKEAVKFARSHGIRKLALDRLILSTAKDPASRRHCDLVVAMMVDRLITPRSKLGFVRAVDQESAISSLGAVVGLGKVKEREAYEALDWLLERQTRIENGLARRHLDDGVLVFYDVTSSYFEGRCCPLAHYGHTRDHRRDRPQIVYGLLCTREGLPIAVEVFDGNTADPSTLRAQVEKVKDRFAISRTVLVGDRGMITSARIRDDLRPAGLDWITCLRAPAIQALARDDGPLQLSLFDERDLAEISAPDMFSGERLIVCRNRDLAA